MFKGRQTVDVVVILLSLLVATTMIIATVGLVLCKAFRPEIEIRQGAEMVGGAITTILGALIGFVGGRAQGKNEAIEAINGNLK